MSPWPGRAGGDLVADGDGKEGTASPTTPSQAALSGQRGAGLCAAGWEPSNCRGATAAREHWQGCFC